MQSEKEKPTAKPVQVRLAPQAYEWVRGQAESQERSINWIITRLIDKEMAHAPQQVSQ